MEFIGYLVIAAFVVGASKGGLATAGALAVPFLSIWMDPRYAAGLLLPIYLVSDVSGLWLYRKDFSWQNVKLLTVAGLVGVIIATILTPYVSRDAAALATGLIGLFYCLQVFARKLRKRDVAVPFDVRRGMFWGTLTGITSYISHNGGPPFQAFVLPQKLEKLKYAGTTTIVFAAINFFKLPAYLSVGIMTDFEWKSFLIMAVVATVGAVVGRWITQVLPSKIYFGAIQVSLFFLSIYLIVNSVSAMV